MTDKSNPQTLASHFTGINGISTHDVAVTEDEQFLFTGDENLGGHIKVWDISDYTNINLVDEYQTPNGGIYRSTDGGLTWSDLSNRPKNLRDWVANIKINPEFIYHFTQSIQLDFRARATPIHDPGLRRQLFSVILEREGLMEELEDRITYSNLFKVDFLA